MRKFIVSTIINCNLYPTMDVVMADDIHKIMDDDAHPTEKMMEILTNKSPYIASYIKRYKPKRKDIYCNYICIDNDLMPSPHKID